MSLASPISWSIKKAPKIPAGSDRITASGIRKLSYCAQSTMYTKANTIRKIQTASLPRLTSSRERPVNSMSNPRGSVSLATSWMALMASPEE